MTTQKVTQSAYSLSGLTLLIFCVSQFSSTLVMICLSHYSTGQRCFYIRPSRCPWRTSKFLHREKG
jgi:hypothetical protein